jgi:hypothetical protein
MLSFCPLDACSYRELARGHGGAETAAQEAEHDTDETAARGTAHTERTDETRGRRSRG